MRAIPTWGYGARTGYGFRQGHFHPALVRKNSGMRIVHCSTTGASPNMKAIFAAEHVIGRKAFAGFFKLYFAWGCSMEM